jgi:alkylhydroperoxidase family enzyme
MWIRVIDDREWVEGDLAELHGEVVDPRYGRVDKIMQVHSLDPGSLNAHLVLYRQAMRGTSTLRKVDRELIAYVVSSINDCHY